MTDKKLTSDGAEILDSTPMSIPLKFKKSESIDERVARILDHSHQKRLEEMGFETFDEADDFDIPDDPIDPSTPWENDYDLSIAHAVNHGVVQKPDVSESRVKEIKGKIKPKRSKQLDIIDYITSAVEKAVSKAKEAPPSEEK